MKKLLVTNPQQIVDLIFDACNSVEDCEYELGIDFAYESDPNVFKADFNFPCKDEDPYEGEDVNQNVWRKREDCILPKTYPVLMVYYIEDGFDRFGDVEIRLYEFVTLEDFKA
jgi:hypothetical protein